MSFKLLLPSFVTSSGQIYLAEEEDAQQQTKIKHFALNPTQYFSPQDLIEEQKLKGNKSFRQYTKLLNLQKERGDYYGPTIAQKIRENRSKNQGFDISELNHYLIQLLSALYLLHSNDILGRVFSTENIIDGEDGIVLMDFGFAADIYSPECEIDILTSPEIITSLLSAQMAKYDMKLDSWLLGAFLYHLGKLDPINTKQEQQKNYFFKQNKSNILHEYDNYLKKLSFSLPHIKFQTKRYPLEFCNFVESLLRYDQSQRLSFSQIYKNEYIRGLNLKQSEQIIRFYENFEKLYQNSITQQNVIKREQNRASQIFLTKEQSPLKSDISQITDIMHFYPYYFKNLQDSEFKLIWLYINMEQFKFSILSITFTQVNNLLKNNNFGLEEIVAYNFQKMGVIILKELLIALKSNESPWPQIKQQMWLQFNQTVEKISLEQQLNIQIICLELELKKLFHICEKFINDERIDISIKEDLIQDKQSNFVINQKSQEFLHKSYRQITQNLYMFLFRAEKIEDAIRKKWKELQLLSLFCHLINRIFNLDSINNQFKFIKNGNLDYLSPSDIFCFIKSKDNDLQKEEEMIHLMQKYFKI